MRDKIESQVCNILPLCNINISIHANNKYNLSNFLIINILIGSIIEILLLIIIFPQTNEELFIYVFWFYFIIYGFLTGFIMTSLEAILVEIMPKKIAGFGFGLKAANIYIFKAIAPLAVGLLWDQSKNWLFYIQGCCFGIIVCLLIIVVLCETCITTVNNAK